MPQLAVHSVPCGFSPPAGGNTSTAIRAGEPQVRADAPWLVPYGTDKFSEHL